MVAAPGWGQTAKGLQGTRSQSRGRMASISSLSTPARSRLYPWENLTPAWFPTSSFAGRYHTMQPTRRQREESHTRSVHRPWPCCHGAHLRSTTCGKSFTSNCSSRIYIAAYANGNLQFDGYHYAGHIDDIPGNAGSSYKYFACPANALPMDGGDAAQPAGGSSTSYRCQTLASGGHL